MKRFSKLGKIFAATAGVAAIAASIGLTSKPAMAEGDEYNTGLPHIYIDAGESSAAPKTYPQRFTAVQIFKGDPGEGGHEKQLTNIAWGDSIDVNALLNAMASATNPIGNVRDGWAVPDGIAGDLDTYKTKHTFGDLFKYYCAQNYGVDVDSGGNITDGKVTAHAVAEFLNVFAYGTDDTSATAGYASASPYSGSTVAEAFSRIVKASGLKAELQNAADGTETEKPEWQSYGLAKTNENGTDVTDDLFPGSLEAGNGKGWVIDEVSGNTAQGLPTGYYLVYDTFKNFETDGSDAISENMLRVVDSDGAFLEIKSDVPELDKKIKGVDTGTDADSVAIGDYVTYSLKGTLPENVYSFHDASGNRAYHMTFQDTLGEGLTAPSAEDIEVYVGTTETDPDSLPTGATKIDLTKSTTDVIQVTVDHQNITVDIKNLFNLKQESGDDPIAINDAAAVEPETVIYVVYKAQVNTKAEITLDASETLANTATLKFSTDPNVDGGGDQDTTPEDETQLYTYGINIHKHENRADGSVSVPGAGMAFIQGDNSGMAEDSRSLPKADTKIALFVATPEGDGHTYDFAGWASYSDDMATQGKLNGTVKGNFDEDGTFTADPDGGTEYRLYCTTADDPAEGLVNFRGLDEGTYTVFEALTPDGYETMDPYTLVLSAGNESESASDMDVTADNTDLHTASQAGGTVTANVADLKRYDLPTTGGMGTALFIGAGVVLVVTACAYTAARKRRAEDAE